MDEASLLCQEEEGMTVSSPATGRVPGFGKVPLWSCSWFRSTSSLLSPSLSSSSFPSDLRVDRSAFSAALRGGGRNGGCCQPSSPSLLQFDEWEGLGLAGAGLEGGVEGVEAAHQ